MRVIVSVVAQGDYVIVVTPRGPTPDPRDPNGIHAAIWEQVQDDPYQPPANQQLALVAYECGLTTRAYIEPIGRSGASGHAAVFSGAAVCTGAAGGELSNGLDALSCATERFAGSTESVIRRKT